MFLALLLAAYAQAAVFPAAERSTAPITVVFPTEGFAYPTIDHAWLIGTAQPGGVFRVNGETVTVGSDGAYIAWLPVSPGTFTFNASLTAGASSYAYARQVLVAPPPAALPEKPVAFDQDFLSPKQDEQLRAGDWVLARARVSPGATPEFRLGRGPWLPMREVIPSLGVWEGAYLVGPEDEVAATPLQFRAKGRGRAQAQSPGRVEVTRATPLVAVVRGQQTVMVRVGPGEGDLFSALGGTRLLIGGKHGGDAKVLLSGGQVGFIEGKSLEYLPAGAQPPRAQTEVVTVKGSEQGSVVHVGLGERVPFAIEESQDLSALTVRFHYTYLHTNWIVYDESDDFVAEVRLKQEAADVVAMTVRLKPGRRLWGYWPTFEGNALRLELRKPPRLARRGPVLAGLRVFLDAGHMPSAPGAIGPLGTKEMDVNLAIARAASQLLRSEGAIPILSRSSPEDEVSLADRPRLALERKADVFVSIHNNFLPATSNPFKGAPHGYSVFYYHPHSLDLAREVYAAYGRDVPLPGEEPRFGDLLVCRLSAVPAILTESAYLAYPEQERLLLDAAFREKIARAIVNGLRAAFQQLRQRQQ